MATEKRNIEYTSLDFDDIKESLIDYIKKDKTFNSANFEGSGLNILADLLAYVTHMTAVTANMSANEMFMDSAQLRQSIVSKAKELGYRPTSMRTPKARLKLTFTEPKGDGLYVQNSLTEKGVRTDPETKQVYRENVYILSGTRFATKVNSVFSTKEDVIAPCTRSMFKREKVTNVQKVNGKWVNVTEYKESEYKVYEVEVDVYEGKHVKFTYTVDKTNPDQRFYISSDKADISTLIVTVQPHDTTDVELYVENDNLNLLNSESRVYFLHQNPDDYFEVTFGDGVLGKALEHGDKIVMSYIVADKGAEMNGNNYFEKAEVIDGFNNYTIEVIEPALGGFEQESGEQIRHRASRMWKAQNRAVVKEDYEALMLAEYPWIDKITTWGGQYNNPPQYGKVFFAIKPRHTDILPYNLKEKIKKEMIEKYNVVTVIPEFVDPDYIYVGVRSNVQYNAPKTTRTADSIASEITDRIVKYFADTVEDFNVTLYLSPMIGRIDSTDKCIIASKTTLYISKRIYPQTYTEERFLINFSNALKPGTFISSYFNDGSVSIYVPSYLKDDGEGIIHLYAVNSDTNLPLIYNAGNINYETGEVELLFTPYAVPTTKDIKLYAETVEDNIKQSNFQIILKDDAVEDQYWGIRKGIDINMIPVGIPVN